MICSAPTNLFVLQKVSNQKNNIAIDYRSIVIYCSFTAKIHIILLGAAFWYRRKQDPLLCGRTTGIAANIALPNAKKVSLPGWLVLVTRRHIEAVAELTEAESVELGHLLQRTSHALHLTTGCLKTYVIQFAEAAGHPHVHFHVVPRMADQPQDRRGPQIFGYLGAEEHDRVSDEAMNELAGRIQTVLEAEDD